VGLHHLGKVHAEQRVRRPAEAGQCPAVAVAQPNVAISQCH
jgi:hypothetical protein